MLGLTELLCHLVELVGRNELLVIEVLLAIVVDLGLLQIDVSQTYTGLSRTQRSHIRNHFHLGNDLTLLDIVASLLQNLGDDTRNLGLDIYLVARLNLTSNDSGLSQIVDCG